MNSTYIELALLGIQTLNLLQVILLVIGISTIAACFTVFIHTIIGSPQVHEIQNADGVHVEVEVDNGMIFSFIGDFFAVGYTWVHNQPIDVINPFKVFMCQFCLNVWVSGLLAVAVIQNSSLNWYYFFVIVVFSSFIRRKYVY